MPLALLAGLERARRELEIPLDLFGAQELLLEEGRALRLLLANERPFLLWAGTGLDAASWVHASAEALARGNRDFLHRGLRVLPYEFPTGGHDRRCSAAATFAVICHARHYAGDWVIAPEASLDSEEMDVLLFSGRGRWKFLSLFRQIQLGESGHLSRRLATIVRGREVTVRSLENYPVEVHVDGDCVLETPITCRAAGTTVSILVPRQVDSQQSVVGSR